MHDTAIALHKDRWVEIVIRHDGFMKMLNEFVDPFITRLLDSRIISSFYYYASPECDDILVLNFKTTQYRLNSLKSDLFSSLQIYFGPQYLAALGIQQLDETVLEKKTGFIAYDWKNIRILGIEEFSFNRFPFTKATYGKEELACLLAKSSGLILAYFRSLPLLPPDPPDLYRKRFDFLVPVLQVFLQEPEEMPEYKTMDDWKQAVIDCKDKLEELESRGLLHIWEYKKEPSDISGKSEREIRNSRVVAYIFETINGQLGIPSAYKGSLQLL